MRVQALDCKVVCFLYFLFSEYDKIEKILLIGKILLIEINILIETNLSIDKILSIGRILSSEKEKIL